MARPDGTATHLPELKYPEWNTPNTPRRYPEIPREGLPQANEIGIRDAGNRLATVFKLAIPPREQIANTAAK